MGKFINRLVRFTMKLFSPNELAQATGADSAAAAIDPEMPKLLRKAAAEGCVLLKNEKQTLPLAAGTRVSVFGRVQFDYFYVGYGSGGDVRTPYTVSLLEGLKNNPEIALNQPLAERYQRWCTRARNRADEGFWGHWPRFFPEMPLKDAWVKEAAESSDAAVVVIGRAAGEDRENILKKGSYFLTDRELKMLRQVTAEFDNVIVVIDSGNIMDMSWTLEFGDKIGAILWAWQGGMESGNAIADVLCGAVNPSGKLSDSIALHYEDYPGADHFGALEFNNYVEDIFVGYRYFETFAKDKVLYPFGFGLSYSRFGTECLEASEKDGKLSFKLQVKNMGPYAGRHVVQLYAEAPQGLLGKPSRVLAGFAKTRCLENGESETLEICFQKEELASYDDAGKTGFRSAYVLERGTYTILAGNDVRDAVEIFSFCVENTHVTRQLSETAACAPGTGFRRLVAREQEGAVCADYEDVPTATIDLKTQILSEIPQDIPQTFERKYRLKDVKDGTVKMADFIAQLTPDELELLSRGEGTMNSLLGAAGNAGAFAGVSESLRCLGIPPVITNDGPAGIRLKATSSLLPCGTALACTFDTECVKEIYQKVGDEMLARETDVILSPGINIHRNPLCGRNFEYFSEDPLLAGKMAAASVEGTQHHGLSACPKHFACNNQETNRNYNDSRLSERALREIYLRPFEIAVKEASPKNIMTSYNKINGVHGHYHYELCTRILRGEWGYTGNVITDWWMRYAPSPEFPAIQGNAYRVRAQVDVLMPGGKTSVSKKAEPDGTLLESLGRPDGITLAELQRTAENVLRFAMESSAFDRFINKTEKPL